MEQLGNPIGLNISLSIFKDTYLCDKELISLKKTAIFNGLSGLYLRTIAWRVWLGVLPTPISINWVEVIKQNREKYNLLIKKYFDGDKQRDNNTESNEDIKDLNCRINKDIDRLFNMYDYFMDENFRNKIRRMLYIYAREHENMNYQQGFHELIAILYHSIDFDLSEQVHIQWKNESSFPKEYIPVVQCLIDRYYIENDCYILFECLMKQLGFVYEIKREQDRNETSVIQQKSDELFERINNIDKIYYDVLISHDIIPSVFGIRWIKMLFAREFHIEDVVEIWDAIFAYGENLKLVDGVFLSMMLYVRNDIVERDDPTYTLRRLMKFPPVFALRPLIDMAVSICDRTSKISSIQQQNLVNFNPVKAKREKRKAAKFSAEKQHLTISKKEDVIPSNQQPSIPIVGHKKIDKGMSRNKQKLIEIYNNLIDLAGTTNNDHIRLKEIEKMVNDVMNDL
ncbi:hypothetical protein ENUP19_0248G0058 [Entamoeba nuttalli]|uniref:Rab GTPase activating protein, putative n=2 Tax=Entamoeba nuttalli TaxID=412467 RepID=K2H2D6_ENTNP|nr:Rab GTPase activating protein, putative [Entamoeba nuttalli P19]EKE40472.1 Rab GTPase activating protein, putative [Entamoeba nuttalli P19]|eukprot:XP_008857195.1 Rab GTPase activating protein, putative [Entamoeba nuttalli P19]